MTNRMRSIHMKIIELCFKENVTYVYTLHRFTQESNNVTYMFYIDPNKIMS